MITIHKALQEARDKLENKTATPLLDAQVILCHVLKVDKLYLIMHKERILTKEEVYEYNEMIKKRLCGVPVQYIIGKQEFMGLDFHVEEGVLIPRPDTEILVEKVLNSIDKDDKYNIVDIGTGSGAITISLAKYMEGSHVYSIDISKKALDIAAKNAESHGVLSRITFLNGSLFKPLNDIGVEGQIDILVSNPPYIPTADIENLQIEVSKFEPKLALDGGEDGLDFYREIINTAPKYVRSGGLIALEVGHDQARRVIELMKEKKGYVDIEITKDLSGIERVVSAGIKF
ncbi:peptide chain release factor N(5)-glutamine methyltransferase [Paramaledivibacter caminithermalis]|jgi:release factor glutamine methyltransferase|uniref:Release factor glutamine methyltransferase n=1 Tax=Paramaledivibacter caminithermalis (strain DSM 15212 / CIP 107654 / DViRD3) TaxID=1121301 RepID=A0A1M6L1Z6_PARC5|nr:peptide chain release factor N(5)-glutamine methyltransferase [Paramaledivibacter caminithermalis]SHJ65261.1 release factor glutamine methyltransferase [Paramaledivibacter caminithermalis DSM 15212]